MLLLLLAKKNPLWRGVDKFFVKCYLTSCLYFLFSPLVSARGFFFIYPYHILCYYVKQGKDDNMKESNSYKNIVPSFRYAAHLLGMDEKIFIQKYVEQTTKGSKSITELADIMELPEVYPVTHCVTFRERNKK